MAIRIDKHVPINNPRERGLNEKEGRIIEVIMTAPKAKQTAEAAKVLEELGSPRKHAQSVSGAVAEIRKRPHVMAALKAASEKAEGDIIEIAEYSKTLGKTGGKEGAAYAGVALAANKEILDRVHGKSKQSLDVTTKSVTINMDLTESLPSEVVVI